MKIGIIGSGNVGTSLGTRWAKAGHTVVFGSRTPDAPKIKELAQATGAKVATQAEAAAESDVILLATPWPATKDVLGSLPSLAGKVVIDAVNPLLPKLEGLEIGTSTSAGEQIASWIPGAKVVKAFNTIGSNIMADSAFSSGKPVLFYAGDDAGAKEIVRELAEQLGFDAQDLGPLRQSRLLEPFALLWISNAILHGREIAFQIMKR